MANENVWDETWAADNGVINQDDGSFTGLVCYRGFDPSGLTVLRGHLAACAPEMARMLKELNPALEEEGCRMCHANWPKLHNDDCRWLVLMRKARVQT
jgi:hypothetical protein